MARAKKLFTFENMELINNITADLASQNNTIESAVVEDAILNSYLTNNSLTREFVKKLYAKGVDSALEQLYVINAAGINNRVLFSDYLDFVRFSLKTVSENDSELKKDEEEYNYLFSKINGFDDLSFDGCTFFSDVIYKILNNWDSIGESTLVCRIMAAIHQLREGKSEDTITQRCELRKLFLEKTVNWSL